MRTDAWYGELVHALGWERGEIVVARTFWRRLVGLMGRRARCAGECGVVMVFPHCSSVHTFGMRAPIDVAFFSDNGRMMACYEKVGPCRVLVQRGAAVACERIHAPGRFGD